MEKLLARLAQQLDAIDEASLMSLWSKYATAVSRFEPTKRWDEAALIFSLIQAKRWKNQLFNYHWARQTMPDVQNQSPTAENLMPDFKLELGSPLPAAQPVKAGQAGQAPQNARRCRVLNFQPEAAEGAAADAPETGEAAPTKPDTDKPDA